MGHLIGAGKGFNLYQYPYNSGDTELASVWAVGVLQKILDLLPFLYRSLDWLGAERELVAVSRELCSAEDWNA